MRNEAPIQGVDVPVSSSAPMAGVAVDTLVWSRKETRRQMEREPMEMRSVFWERVLRWPPMLSLSLSEEERGGGEGVAWVVGCAFSVGWRKPFSAWLCTSCAAMLKKAQGGGRAEEEGREEEEEVSSLSTVDIKYIEWPVSLYKTE